MSLKFDDYYPSVRVRRWMKARYEQFLESDLWRATARRIRIRDDHRCQRCGYRDDPNYLVIHHTDTGYGHPNRNDAPWYIPEGWLPDDFALSCLCRECHAYIHGYGPDPLTNA